MDKGTVYVSVWHWKHHGTPSIQVFQGLPQTCTTKPDITRLPGAPSTPAYSSLTQQPTRFRLSSTGSGAVLLGLGWKHPSPDLPSEVPGQSRACPCWASALY